MPSSQHGTLSSHKCGFLGPSPAACNVEKSKSKAGGLSEQQCYTRHAGAAQRHARREKAATHPTAPPPPPPHLRPKKRPARRTNLCATSTRQRNNPSSFKCCLGLSHTPRGAPLSPEAMSHGAGCLCTGPQICRFLQRNIALMQLSLTNPQKNLGQAPAHATCLHPAPKEKNISGAASKLLLYHAAQHNTAQNGRA
jgi:hypothetical protein